MSKRGDRRGGSAGPLGASDVKDSSYDVLAGTQPGQSVESSAPADALHGPSNGSGGGLPFSSGAASAGKAPGALPIQPLMPNTHPNSSFIPNPMHHQPMQHSQHSQLQHRPAVHQKLLFAPSTNQDQTFGGGECLKALHITPKIAQFM